MVTDGLLITAVKAFMEFFTPVRSRASDCSELPHY